MDPNECVLLFNGSCYEREGENKAARLESVTSALSAERADLIHTGFAVLAKSRRGRKKEGKKTSSRGVCQLYNATRQQISSILSLELTAALFSAERFLAVGGRAADGLMCVVVRVGADRILRKKSEL